jgi:hypothetical protein
MLHPAGSPHKGLTSPRWIRYTPDPPEHAQDTPPVTSLRHTNPGHLTRPKLTHTNVTSPNLIRHKLKLPYHPNLTILTYSYLALLSRGPPPCRGNAPIRRTPSHGALPNKSLSVVVGGSAPPRGLCPIQWASTILEYALLQCSATGESPQDFRCTANSYNKLYIRTL